MLGELRYQFHIGHLRAVRIVHAVHKSIQIDADDHWHIRRDCRGGIGPERGGENPSIHRWR